MALQPPPSHRNKYRKEGYMENMHQIGLDIHKKIITLLIKTSDEKFMEVWRQTLS